MVRASRAYSGPIVSIEKGGDFRVLFQYGAWWTDTLATAVPVSASQKPDPVGLVPWLVITAAK